MDSSAYLVKQGWRGKGHGLHATGRGIKKPILVSKKNNSLGVGKKRNDVHADQWWARAFDSGLKSLNIGLETPPSETNRQVTSLELLVQAGASGNSRWGGLYSGFVKGDTLESTISGGESEVAANQNDSGRDQETPVSERTSRKMEKRRRKCLNPERPSPEESAAGNSRSQMLESTTLSNLPGSDSAEAQNSQKPAAICSEPQINAHYEDPALALLTKEKKQKKRRRQRRKTDQVESLDLSSDETDSESKKAKKAKRALKKLRNDIE